ncbi:MAG: Wzz/FepE/Etk N-terminal domain-containing protein [Bacteroidota bacterium]
MTVEQSENKKQDYVGSAFLEFLTVIIKFRWFLFWFIFTITVSATAYALIAPKWFRSSATVLPAERTDFLGGLSGLSSLVKGFSASKGLASLTGNTETDRYVAILQSATVIDRVISKYDLRKVYDLEDTYYEKVVKELFSNVDFEIRDEGQLTISVLDKDPQQAADMANFFVEQLNELNSTLHVQNAKANREFIEKRYFQNVQDIENLESDMQSFQEQHGVIAVPEQIEQTVKTMAGIYSQLAQKEIEFSVLKRMHGSDHPLAYNTGIELEEISKKIKKLNSGEGYSQKDAKLLIPFNEAPELGNKYLKIYRSLEIQYAILEFITPLYEQAKVEEIRNTPSVLVLDKAGPAERKAKPKGSIYAVVSFIISSFFALLIMFTRELFSRLKATSPDKMGFITQSIQRDFEKFPFIKKRKS